MNTRLVDRTIDSETSLSKRVVIIGGGITGLSAAWQLQRSAAQQSIPLQYTILEQSDRWGGKIQTDQVDGFGDAPFIIDYGPDAFLTRKPWAYELARELGLSDAILAINVENNKTFVLHSGKPVPLPEGLQLLVPTQWKSFIQSPLFSPWGKLRASLDWVIPQRQSDADETLASFVRRRLGAEVLDRVAEPMLGGVFNGDSEKQSMLATFPQFPAMEKQHGSLIRGSRLAARERKAVSNAIPPFISFKTGTNELVKALINQLTGDMRLNCVVSRIERLADNRYRISTSDGKTIEADALIMATPANVTVNLLQNVAPQASGQLSAIPYSGIGSAFFAFRREDVPHPLKGFGLVVPGSEKRKIDGVTWISSKWNHRAPSGHVLLRMFFGGPRTLASLQMDDKAIYLAICAELRDIFGITTAPLFHRIYRWMEGYPQYNLGHLERVASAESALPSTIKIAGSAYKGVGVPDCVRQGREAATCVMNGLKAELGVISQ